MTLPVILQARMGSSRLPGKVLLSYQSESLLEIQISRIKRCSLVGEIIVATSESSLDQPIIDYCRRLSIPCVVGSELNVVERFLSVLNNRKEEGFIRFCADRPLFDWRLLEYGIKLFESSGADIVTNASPPTFPKGQTVEIMKREVFLRAVPHIIDPLDQEHVMTYFYKRGNEFQIINFTAPHHNFNSINLCVDSELDFQNFKKIASSLGKNYKDATWEETVKVYKGICAE